MQNNNFFSCLRKWYWQSVCANYLKDGYEIPGDDCMAIVFDGFPGTKEKE